MTTPQPHFVKALVKDANYGQFIAILQFGRAQLIQNPDLLCELVYCRAKSEARIKNTTASEHQIAAAILRDAGISFRESEAELARREYLHNVEEESRERRESELDKLVAPAFRPKPESEADQ
jgi:hypothetical protein